MLAYLPLLPHLVPYRRRLVGITLAVGAAALGARSAQATDTLPIGNLDARASGPVLDANGAPQGSVAAQLNASGAVDAVRPGQLGEAGTGDRQLLGRTGGASLLVSYGATKNLDLSLGLHGTYEDVAPADRDGLNPAGASTWRQGLKAAGFTGASLLLKAQVVDRDGLKVAVAPFLESGAGQDATYALTRSVSPQGGAMGIVTVGTKGVAEASLDLGVRYRDPEAIGTVTLRNEQFGKVGVTAWITQSVSLLAAYDTRRLMVARAPAGDGEGSRVYHPELSAAATLGASAKLGDVAVTAYASKGLNLASGFGYGDRALGLSVGWELGEAPGIRPRHSYATEVEREIEAEKRAAARAAAAKKAAAAAAQPAAPKLAPTAASAEASDALGPETVGDDFKDLGARAAQIRRDADSGESEDAKIERELNEIHAAEAKVEAARAKAAAAEKERSRQAALRQAPHDEALRQERMEEATKKAAAIPGIEDQDMQWNGLNDD